MDSGIMAAIIGAVGAISSAAVTAVIAQRRQPGALTTPSSSDSISNGSGTLPAFPLLSRGALLLRAIGILLVGTGVGLLAAGTAIYGAEVPKLEGGGPVIGATLIGFGSASLSVGILTILCRRLP